MDLERWPEIDKLLQSAMERPPSERDLFLRRACAGDEPLEREVRSLLAAHDRADSFLSSPAIDAAASQAAAAGDDDPQAGRDPLIARSRTIASSRNSAAAAWALSTRPRTAGCNGLSR